MRALTATAAIATALIWCPAAGAQAKAGDRYERGLADLVNEYRVRNRLRTLTVDPALAALAREHSVAMAEAKRLSHDEFPSRVGRSGRAMCVENVGWNYPSPAAQFEGWRASPGHDRNMLDPRVERVGIGAAADYVTLIACQ